MFSSYTISETGGRAVNEDSVAVRESGDGLFCVLADGLGGHGAGEVASGLAVETAVRVFEEDTLFFDELLPACVMAAQTALLNEQRRLGRQQDIKTTLAFLHIKEGLARWAHVGDSRLYHFAGGTSACTPGGILWAGPCKAMWLLWTTSASAGRTIALLCMSPTKVCF